MMLGQKDQHHRISASKGGLNPQGLDVVAVDSLLVAGDPKNNGLSKEVIDGEPTDGQKIYDDVDIRSPRADHNENSHIDKLD